MQYPIRVKVLQAEEYLVEVSHYDDLCEHAVFVQQTGDASPRHPLDEDVDVSSLLYGPVHPHHVRVLQPRYEQHLLSDQLLHLLLLLVAVPAEADLLGGHDGACLSVPGLVAGAVGSCPQHAGLGPVHSLAVLSAGLTILHHLHRVGLVTVLENYDLKENNEKIF